MILYLFKGNVDADVLTAFFTEKHVSAGENVTLSCNYTGYVNNLQWYRQYPRSKPQFLVLHTELSGQSEFGLYAAADKEVKRMDLSIFSTQVTDSVYYCALKPTVTRNKHAVEKPAHSRHHTRLHRSDANVNPIRPDNTSVCITEGHNITLSCTYDGSAKSLHWYRQTSGSTPQFLVLIMESSKYITKSTPPQAHMSISLHDKHVYLEISSVKVTDSDLYYCALQPTKPGSNLEFLLMIDEASEYVTEANPPHLRLSIKLHKAKKRVTLEISSAAVRDSAVYYCALRPTVTGNTCTLYKNLQNLHVTIPLQYTELQINCFLFCDAVLSFSFQCHTGLPHKEWTAHQTSPI
ncbi:uncharacterized protein LOC130554081 [Triplophysa rosa]|uniref:uncharacterized protein LOC130554081 n=1 Tax=Triplophysa rosa TaxID=992332 RepID=UPI002545D41B|nr:uncharacterized protein LOC130554081 [Triplophysa rosa]